MGYKLNGSKLAYCSDHIVTYRKMNNGRRLKVVCDSKDSGEKVHSYLRSVYNSKGYDKGWDWEDFTMVFKDTWNRDYAFADMDGAITEYRETHPDDPIDPQTNGTDEPEKSQTDWTTYIIIGVAAVAILLLLFGKKKKG